MLVAGPNFMPQAYRDTPLARLMPFDPAKARNPEPDKPLNEGFVAQPTEMGLASPSMQLDDTPEQSQADLAEAAAVVLDDRGLRT